MAERAINQKKAQLLQSFAPVSITLDELIREKLVCGKFPLTKTGWIKIIAVVVSLAALALFIAQSQCEEAATWFPYVLPVCTGASIFVQLFFYFIFSFGLTIKYPGKWVTADIVFNLCFSVIAIIGSSMSTNESTHCVQNKSMHGIPGPIGIAGGVITLGGCAAIFLLYRYVDDELSEEENATQTAIQRSIDPRKSLHV